MGKVTCTPQTEPLCRSGATNRAVSLRQPRVDCAWFRDRSRGEGVRSWLLLFENVPSSGRQFRIPVNNNPICSRLDEPPCSKRHKNHIRTHNYGCVRSHSRALLKKKFSHIASRPALILSTPSQALRPKRLNTHGFPCDFRAATVGSEVGSFDPEMQIRMIRGLRQSAFPCQEPPSPNDPLKTTTNAHAKQAHAHKHPLQPFPRLRDGNGGSHSK
jgi:hypothetical protein